MTSSLTAVLTVTNPDSDTPPAPVTDGEQRRLLDALTAVPDPRNPLGVCYPLTALLAVAVCAVLAGASSFAAIADWLYDLEEQDQIRLGFTRGVPAGTTVWRLLSRVDAALLSAVLAGWLRARAQPVTARHRLPEGPGNGPRPRTRMPTDPSAAVNRQNASMTAHVQDGNTMKIGILGSGNIGATLTRRLSAAGHQVKVANSRGPETIPAAVLDSGAQAVHASEVAADVDVLIVSVPLVRVPEVKPLLAGLPAGAVIIDTSNYYPMRDGQIEALDNGQAESLWVAEHYGRPVVKAWNAITSPSLDTKNSEAGTPGRIAIPVAANNDADRAVGMTLVEETGFDAVDAGTLAGRPGPDRHRNSVHPGWHRGERRSRVDAAGPRARDGGPRPSSSPQLGRTSGPAGSGAARPFRLAALPPGRYPTSH